MYLCYFVLCLPFLLVLYAISAIILTFIDIFNLITKGQDNEFFK